MCWNGHTGLHGPTELLELSRTAVWGFSPDPAEKAAARTFATETPVTKQSVINRPD